jgi:hypothetical protein
VTADHDRAAAARRAEDRAAVRRERLAENWAEEVVGELADDVRIAVEQALWDAARRQPRRCWPSKGY